MRLFLDLHMSGRVYAAALRGDGHDVVVGADDPTYAAMPDADLLRRCTADGRIMVSFDVDYSRIARAWSRDGRDHGGVILLVGMDSNAYAIALRAIRDALASQPRQETWRNLLLHAGGSSA